MQRREFMTLVGGATATWPLGALAQTAPVRIGFLASGAAGSPNSADQIDAIKQGLRENGLVEGRDYILDAHFAAGDYEQFPEMARKLAQAGARVIPREHDRLHARGTERHSAGARRHGSRSTTRWEPALSQTLRGRAGTRRAWRH